MDAIADRYVLDFGCGIGRDVSPAMLPKPSGGAAARATLVEHGHSLSGIAASEFDLVLAAESFPY
jgi:hypothetical protein